MTSQLPVPVDSLADALTQRGWIPPGTELLTPRQVAGLTQMSVDWVRDHAGELGGVAMGADADRPALRFSRRHLEAYIERQALAGRLAVEPTVHAPSRRSPRDGGAATLLPFKRDGIGGPGVGSGRP